MAESLVNIGDDSEKNFILAKLVSIYGDIVEFDVISLVAQENEWNEEKCIEYLKVLGDYKEPDANSKCLNEDPRPPIIESKVFSAASDGQLKPPQKAQVEEAAQHRERSYTRVAANPKTVKPKMAGNGGNAQGRIPPIRQLSPSNSGVQKSVETQEHHDRVKELIKSGVPVLILLRGLPGSGKSTLGKNLLSTTGGKGSIHSTDDFFHVPRGSKGTLYQYDPLRLGEAHEWNRVQVLRAIAHGVSPIIVDNTNVQKWEMLPYVEMALEPWEAENKLRNMAANGSLPKNNICSSLGPARQSMIGKKCSCGYIVGKTSKVPYEVELLEPLTWWYRNPARLAKVNQHGVSQKKITQMLSNFDFNVTGKSLVNHMLKIKPNTPAIPQRENIRPSNQSRKQATSSNFSGAPIYNIGPPKPLPGNQFGARPRQMFPPNIAGNNAYNPTGVNPFQNPPRFPPPPQVPQFQYPPSLLNFQAPTPHGQAFSNRNQFSSNNRPQFPQHLIDQWIKDKPKKEDFNMFSLSHQSTFSKSASNISFKPDDNKSGHAYSSQPEGKDENPFKGSLATSESNIHEKSSEAVSFVGSECKEMTEEELNEWTKNNSRWGWESSDEDSEDECKTDENEPKPERILKVRHKDNISEKGLKEDKDGDETSQKSKDAMLDEIVSEWVTEKDDPLITWDTPEVTIENPKEVKTAGPLPPRSSKRKRLVGNLTDSDDSPEEEKKNSISDEAETDVNQQIHSLLGEFGVMNKGLDFHKEISKDNADLVKADNNSSMPASLDSVHVLGDLEECKNSDSSKGYSILNNDAEVSVKLGMPSLEDTEKLNSLKPEICVIESKSMLIEVGMDCLVYTDAVNFISESVSKDYDNKEKPSLTVFDEVLPAKPEEASTNTTSAVNDTAPKKELDFSCRENGGENSEMTSCGTSGQNEMTPENLMLLAPLIKEGLQWFDHSYKWSRYKEKETDNSDKKDDVHVTRLSACEEKFPINLSEATTLVDCIQDTEMISSLEDTPTDQVEVKAQLAEKLEEPAKNEINENAESRDSITSCETELIEINNTSNLSEISHSVPEIKEMVTASHLESADAVILETTVCSNDPVKCLEDERKNIQNLGTSHVCLESGIDVSVEVPDLKNAQEIIKCDANITASDTEALLKEASPIISDENEMQSCIPLTSVTSHSLIFKSEHSCEKEDLSTSEEPSDVKIEPEVENEQAVSLLEILENLRKKKIADKNSASTAEPVVIKEEKEKLSPEKVGEMVDSEMQSYTIVTETGQDLTNVSALSELCINEEKESSLKTTKEKCTTDWSLLYEEGGDTIDIDHESETFPLVLDANFIKQICQKFGNPYQDSMDESSRFNSGNNGSGVTVQVPADLARKLHECWLKTQWNTILDEEEASQKMVIEDELLAHQLQALEEEELKEKREHKSSNTPNLREIMDMEMAMAIYKADQNRNTATPQKNDLSTRLSWDMLTKEFPHIPQDVITEVFSAYNFSYESAREALVASLPDYERGLHESQVKDVISPEILAAQEKALIEKAKLESLKSKEPPVEVEEIVESENEGSWEAQVDQARKAASLNRRLQKERHAQAQAASRSGIPSAAAYYCRMASLHKQKVDEANRKAANILSRVFTGEYNESKGDTTDEKEISRPPKTLDMHSMTVLEALRVLNAFLDAHAEWLRNSNSQNKMVTLFLITGRGVNSLGGIPRIKPAVEKQLEKRGVWYEELNPGLLRVMVSASLLPTRKL